MTSVNSKVIVALDYNNSEAALKLAGRLDPQQCRLKVGKELFTAAGPSLVKELVEVGFDVFLDLKFHDIPNTVAKAVSAAADLGVWMTNVHASGGSSMMIAAKKALVEKDSNMLLIGVTVLTSMDDSDLAEIGVNQGAAEQVLKLANLAKQSGLDDTLVIGIYIFYNLIYALFAFPIGILADKVGLKKIFIIGLLLFSIVYFGMSVNTNLYLFFGLFFLYGIYASATEGISKAWISNITDKKDTATAIGTFSGFQSICTMLASSLAGLIWFQFGSTLTFLITAIATIIIVLYILTIPKPETVSNELN